MSAPRELTILIPAFNEVECIGVVLDELVTTIEAQRLDAHILVIDDGSTDGTASEVERRARNGGRIELLRFRRNRGKAAALQAGFERVTGDITVLMDADGQDDPAELSKLLDELDRGADLVTGRRTERQDRFVKRSTSRLYNWATRRLTGVDGRDFNSGFKVMRTEVADSIELYGDLHRYIPVLAAWAGFTVSEVPVNHRARQGGASKFGRARFWRGYLDLLTVKFITTYTNRPLHLLGGTGTLLGLAGTGILVWLLIDKLRGHAVGARPALAAGVLLVIVGVQLVSLGLVAELIVKFAHRRDAASRRSVRDAG